MIQCDCDHDLKVHYTTSEGDRLPQPCSVDGCDCPDFIEGEGDD